MLSDAWILGNVGVNRHIFTHREELPQHLCQLT